MTASRRESRVWAIVPAAGSGQRFASDVAAAASAAATSAAAATTPRAPKQYATFSGRTVLEWTLRALLTEPRIHAIVVVLSAGDPHWPAVAAAVNSSKLLTAQGGVHRQDSVLNGLEFLASQAADDDWVLVHDAARPCLSADDLRALLDALGPQCQGAVLAAPIVDTVKRQRTGDAVAVATVDRQGLWRALTPQVFKFARLREALATAASAGVTVTDEAQALERFGVHATLVAGSPFNIKVTRAEDLILAAEILNMKQGGTGAARRMRVGQGVDVHTFGAGDHVILAGVRIPYTQGVVAHSDGDVIIHALCDALLGAMGDGDIGQHFPDTDPRYRGADSRVFLRTVAERMRAARFNLINADVTVLAEAPRVNPHRAAMAQNLAADLGVPATLINIKATTTEKMGFIGRKEGLAAMASVLLGDIQQ
jgi:2-C-methyl-D-erythritol 4-phosphate cytidylyltransferase / 2-C-methyl-D-erythritol 2,4-cyclodiphosphate synthase